MIWQGVPLGFDKAGNPISYNKSHDGSGNAPTLVFGPPGSFKSVGLIATQLLDDDSGKRSYVVIDPKGELCAITSKFRRALRGHAVKIINPYNLLADVRPDMASDGWNPLADLDPASPGFIDDCQAKGDALIKTDSNEHQKHFPDSARSGITACVAWEAIEAAAQKLPPSLPNVRNTLCLPPDQLTPVIQRMIDSGIFDIAARAGKFLADNNEINGIKSTIETQTQWMTPNMRDDMAAEKGVDFRDLPRRPMTIYVIIPTEELAAKATFLRLVLSSALRALYRYGGIPTTLIVEEGFVLGHHAEIEQALSILRGFGSRMTIVFQSLTQIKKLYPDTYGLFFAGALLAFRPGDLDTAKFLVEKTGKVTLPVLGASEPRPGEAVPGKSWQARDRDRIPLPKMFAMPRGRSLVWLPGDEVPRISYVRGYFEVPKLARRASPNPYHGNAATRRA